MNREIRRLMEFLKHSEKRITKVKRPFACMETVHEKVPSAGPIDANTFREKGTREFVI